MERRPRHLNPANGQWPRKLDNIADPPSELWALGRFELLERGPCVALVGSRSPTAYGEEQARRFAAALAARGVVVVSGLARGIDSSAHRAALDVGGETVAVLGSGVDRPWPSGELAERMSTEGLLLSEYSPGTPPARHHFPLRNRLISGLSDVIVIVEAAFRSGSLITARWGADQGREVLAVPGRVDQPLARGCHRLLREGAGLVEDPGEVLDLLGLDSPALEIPASDAAGPRARREGPVGGSDGDSAGDRASPADRSDAGILATLEHESATAGELSAKLGRALPPVLAELARLELEGRVTRGPGGIYRRFAPARASPGR